ncbi:probable G-protein coupled receptor 139 [Heptranchias perlo]|uniref:probable G-protein coupled receptor 139 n=1 Tax=Heptranchias perlo TaxID=212740 RepID=UPI00355A85F6
MDSFLIIKYLILGTLYDFQKIYYPVLAAVAVPVNAMTIIVLSRGKCGLAKCVTRYLVAMAAADLLVVITDLILRQIPITYRSQFTFLYHVPVCNIHAVLLNAATDCSVWFTVTFTFDRFVAICCQKLKTKYCTEKTAAVVLGTVSVLFCLKNIFWYFFHTGAYILSNSPWFCGVTSGALFSQMWTGIEFLHYLLTPGVPFVLILLLNALTVRHILVASRARRRLRGHSNRESPSDPEMENRRKSIILLFVISGNFILLWALFLVSVVSQRMFLMGYSSLYLPAFVKEMGFILQLLSCCTNTCIYAMTQTKFREQLKNVVKYPFIPHRWRHFMVLNSKCGNMIEESAFDTFKVLEHESGTRIAYIKRNPHWIHSKGPEHILVASRARRRLRDHSKRQSASEPEMENRRKSIILLFVVSRNFILLWALFLVFVVSERMFLMGYSSVYLPTFVEEMGFKLQLLSCCTNTCIYAITQIKFREQLKNVVKYPFIVIVG